MVETDLKIYRDRITEMVRSGFLGHGRENMRKQKKKWIRHS